MADIVSFVTNPAGTLGGGIAGGAATLAGRALEGVPGGSELVSFALGEVSNLLQGKPDATGIYNAFLSQILQNFVNAPSIAPLWVCHFMPLKQNNSLFSGNVGELADELEAGNFIQEQSNVVRNKAIHNVNSIMGGGFAMMFCQGVETPEDTVSFQRDTYNGNIGGYLPGIVGGNRTVSDVTLSFIENNASFVDFYLRPWLIHNSYNGIPYGIKADIIINQFVKTTPNEPLRVRKSFRLKNAFPVSIDSEKLKYSDTNDARQIKFAYETYSLLGSSENDWVVEQPDTGSSFLSRLGAVALNVATGLVNKQLEKFESNLFSIRPQTVNVSQPSRIENNQQIPVQSKLPNSRDITDIRRMPTQPVTTQLKLDTAVPFEIIANRLQKVITPENDVIGIEETQTIAQTGVNKVSENDTFISSLGDRLFTKVNPPEQDSPSYRPAGRANPTVIPSKQDFPASPVKNSIPVQLKSNRRNDTAADTTIASQSVSVRRGDSIER